MVEDIEYEEQIHCKVQMQKSCQFLNSQAEKDEQVMIIDNFREYEACCQVRTCQIPTRRIQRV